MYAQTLSKSTREQLTENTTIIARAPDRHKLAIKEALYIIKLGPLINKQYDNFTNVLKLYNHRNQTIKSNSKTASHTEAEPLDIALPPNLIPTAQNSLPNTTTSLNIDLLSPPLPSFPSQSSSPIIPISPDLDPSSPPNLISPSQPS